MTNILIYKLISNFFYHKVGFFTFFMHGSRLLPCRLLACRGFRVLPQRFISGTRPWLFRVVVPVPRSVRSVKFQGVRWIFAKNLVIL
ncbi:MAG: hypothetical protein IJC16_03085 [Rikenellaceae bacterium]|nr:hypothetical protein [Rikenellaceae bacterium]